MNNKTAILVLGMSRSGTSALVGAMAHYGISTGNKHLKADVTNEKGYFELEDVWRLNEGILNALWVNWRDMIFLKDIPMHSAKIREFQLKISHIIDEHFSSSEVFAIKDPRLCKLYPIWKKALDDKGIISKFVLPVRNPLEVAASLERVCKFPKEHSLLLWLDSVLSAENYSRGQTRTFVTFNEVINSPGSAVAEIIKKLGLSQIVEIKQDELAEKFISAELKHFYLEDGHVNEESLDFFQRCYNYMQVLANSGPEPEEVLLKLDTLRAEYLIMKKYFYNEEIHRRIAHSWKYLKDQII